MKKFLHNIWLQIQHYYSDFVMVLPKLIFAILIFLVLYFLANRSRNYVNKHLSTRIDDPLLARFIARLVKITMIVFALMVGLKIVGLADIAAGIIAGASVSAIIVGFAFKDIGENLLAGIMLAFNRPFRVGDVVELDGQKGVVVALDLRSSQIKSFDGKDIYIPNANVVKNPVTNYTIDNYLRFDFNIGLYSNADITKAIQIILEEVQSVPGVLEEDKAPTVFVSNLDSGLIILTVFYWLQITDKNISALHIKTQVIDSVTKALLANSIHLPGEVLEIRNYQNNSLSMESN